MQLIPEVETIIPKLVTLNKYHNLEIFPDIKYSHEPSHFYGDFIDHE